MRPTADIDILESRGTDLRTIAKLAGRNSPLHKRHGVYIDPWYVPVMLTAEARTIALGGESFGGSNRGRNAARGSLMDTPDSLTSSTVTRGSTTPSASVICTRASGVAQSPHSVTAAGR
jgi:hypothetical protein